MSDDPREGESFRDDHLDAGIRAAFESQGASTPRAQSVLREIGVVAGGAAERRASADRYELLGEIARGGVGMVLRGRDLDLGREVAVKVLLDRHRRRPRVVERFVEEARIASRLQHPGTVPVYDFGVLRDGRPFFTMKLVDGRTLEDLLATRANVESDRSHFLAIFEQVCHTVAYAHANGVIHRDLKPANVMIGAFGEVQVMDWGLSKALAGGDELEPGSGSVMGTPGYLSPEAARGDVASIDERSDVFGLGGILCEILTGRPPFVAESPFETIPRAAAGNVVDAIARLDACGAEPALIAIAKACLDPDPAARPRGASELAKRVAAHRAAGEERSRRLELAVAEARARASSEKRARRFAVGLAAAVLLGAAGAIWVQADRATRHRETTRDVSRAMEEAQSLRAAARESRDLATWARATAAAQRASALARPDEADRDTVDAARLLVAGVAKDESEARARVAEESADRATVEHVAEVRERAGDSLAWKKVDAEYAAAFSRYQLDPAAPDPGAAIDIDRMRASPIRADLATALDGWAAARLMAFGDKDPQSATLQRVAQAVDADPLRIRLRAAMQQRDLDELRRLAADASAGELPPATLDRLGDALEQAGDSAAALATYQAAQLLHPDDFWLNFQLARLLAGSNPPRKDEAVRFNQAAIAVRPRSAPAWTNLAANFIGTGRYDEAEPSLRRALSLDPDLATAHSNLSALLRAKGKLDDAESEAKEAIRLAPGVAISHSNLAAVLLDRGNVDGALAELEEARRLDPKDEIVRFNLGFLLQRKGRTADAESEFKEALRLRPESGDVHSRFAAFLSDIGRLDEAIREGREAVRLWPNSAEAHANLGAALREHDELDAAIVELREAVRLKSTLVAARTQLGIALWFHGSLDAAEAEFREAVRLVPNFMDANNDLGALLFEKDDDAGALAAFRETVRLAPENATCLANLAMSLSITKVESDRNADEAVRLARRATEIDSRDPRAWTSLGLASYRAGDFAGCVTALDKSFALSKGGHAHDWFFAAMANERLGEHALAHAWFDKAVASRSKMAKPDARLLRAESEAREVLGAH
ncbi:MAG: protein kinase [Planctomycetes bacterium]|nr:protein kinase [Planctomycetota bacterium]